MNKFEYKNLTPFKWFVLENFPFIEADFDALTEWQLFCKLGKEINKIIDSQNVVGTEMEKFSQAFIELQNYVNNYFDNLDVQEEINNKLNKMVEDGTLPEIIASYLNSKAIFGYDNVASMKNATNLINGSYARTLGYYTKNDGGGALYKIRTITNDDVVDEATIIALYDNTLIAELIILNEHTPEQFGYSNDIGSTINLMISKGIKSIKLNSKNYKCVTTINLQDKEYITIYGENKMSSVIIGETGSNPVINMIGSIHIKLEDFSINSTTGFATENPSTLGIVIARSQTHLSSQEHIFKNLNIRLDSSDNTINSNYGSIAIYNYAGESFLIDNCMLHSGTPVFFTNYDLLGIGALYGGYNYSGKSTTDFTFTNDCYILSENSICMKFDTCHSINITNSYFNVKNSGNIFEINANSQNGYEFNNIFVNNIRVEGSCANLFHLLENTKLRNFHVVGGSNTVTNADYLMENNTQVNKGYHQFQNLSQYIAKKVGSNASINGVMIIGDYDKKIDVYGFDRSFLIGSTFSNRSTITSFKSAGISSTGELILNGNNSIMFSFSKPTSTDHKTGDICFCSNSGDDVLCWQFEASNNTWIPLYKKRSV